MEANHIFIMGDSYSTYAGFIPQGYNTYYSDDRIEDAVVHGVERTWWHIVAKEIKGTVVTNDSYSGSTVCNTCREGYPLSSSFVSRMDKYIAEGYFEKNPIDTFFLFGGTNDAWIGTTLGRLQYDNWSEDDLKCVIPAYCYVLDRIQSVADKMRIVAIVNCDINPQVVEMISAACDHYGVQCIRLSNVEKACGHPTDLGMAQIAEQVVDGIKA